MSDWGHFPFGRANSVRPARTATTRAQAVVIGVYPSAWHVTWRAPGGKGGVKALAVDVEPTVFWDGNADDFAGRLADWKAATGFVEGKHGTISAVSPSTNGSSGADVVRSYLEPLRIDVASVTFTDVFPVFLVKTSSGKRREQADAIRSEYDPIAEQLGFRVCTLPPRISNAKLPKAAASMFGAKLMSELAEAEAPLAITLGAEVWETLRAMPALAARPPCEVFTSLYGDAYGSLGSMKVAGREVAWLPLVHPGLLKGALNANGQVDPAVRTIQGWGVSHARWVARSSR